MRPLLFFILLGCSCTSKTNPPIDAGMEAAQPDAPTSCFPSPRGFDPGFKNGAITVSMMPLEAHTMTLDRQGRVLVGGAQGMDSFVARIGTDGKVDTTFGGKGVFTQSFGATADVIESIAVDAQDRIVVGGKLDQVGSDYAFVTRLTSAGALDTAFAAASNNLWLSSVSLGSTHAIAIDQGGVYAMGTSHFVQRILDDGTADPGFTLVQAAMGENIAGSAVADGVVVFDRAGALTKYGKNGMPDASFGGAVFGAMGTGNAFQPNGTGWIVADGATPAHIAITDDKGKPTAMSSTISMSIASLGVACNRIVIGGGSNGDAKLGLLGLDTKPVMGDLLIDSYPVSAPVDSSTSPLFSVIQPDGRVIYVESVNGTGSFEMARVNP